ncbi:MAG: hypothetical protein ACRCWJ_14970 [Casimicrobium sp.]
MLKTTPIIRTLLAAYFSIRPGDINPVNPAPLHPARDKRLSRSKYEPHDGRRQEFRLERQAERKAAAKQRKEAKK